MPRSPDDSSVEPAELRFISKPSAACSATDVMHLDSATWCLGLCSCGSQLGISISALGPGGSDGRQELFIGHASAKGRTEIVALMCE